MNNIIIRNYSCKMQIWLGVVIICSFLIHFVSCDKVPEKRPALLSRYGRALLSRYGKRSTESTEASSDTGG
uniref:Uncharacterized protein n=1 Tax=Heterorhabditis bacteriophora TaxID=37862 RepID=A0A1I7WUT8_HETBA